MGAAARHLDAGPRVAHRVAFHCTGTADGIACTGHVDCGAPAVLDNQPTDGIAIGADLEAGAHQAGV